MFDTLRSHKGTRAAILLATSTLVLAPILTSCGGSESADEPAATQTAANGDVYNDADTTFAQQMIPHHAQAIEMADLIRKRELRPEVAALAERLWRLRLPRSRP